MNKFKKGDQVEYIDLNSKIIKSTIEGYEEVEAIVFGKSVISICARLANGDLVNDRHLTKI